MTEQDEPRQCMIIQDKQTVALPHGSKSLQCDNTGVFIKPECVCSFYNVYEGKYHSHSSCPGNVKSDDVRSLRCVDCMKYSLPNKGPCINGGQLTCNKTGPDAKAPDIICDCPTGFMGMFCEHKLEKVTRICDRIENASSLDLKNCDVTKMECITYSEKKLYAFKCNENSAITQEGQIKLPLCSETEIYHTNQMNTVITPEGDINNRRRLSNHHYISGVNKCVLEKLDATDANESDTSVS
ncbi:uncharacterized protein LOC133172034 [Saccostrea echinata]|uniref:uncharacterized protein LOC133172034 n=1 Tax=Saccostrea echinata TaxID=191078 RepID=UPI002A82468E|nr:uncharacterized protein LOC133172034 [Saccostrea echinata]